MKKHTFGYLVKMRKIIEKQEPAWGKMDFSGFSGACLRQNDFLWFFSAQNAKDEKIGSMENGRKMEPAWGKMIFSEFEGICRNSGFHEFAEICRNS